MGSPWQPVIGFITHVTDTVVATIMQIVAAISFGQFLLPPSSQFFTSAEATWQKKRTGQLVVLVWKVGLGNLDENWPGTRLAGDYGGSLAILAELQKIAVPKNWKVTQTLASLA